MAEEFALSSLVIPGTYIRVRAEGLISVGGISTGNIGIVGTVDPPKREPVAEETEEEAEEAAEKAAAALFEPTHSFSDYRTAIDTLGRYDAYTDGAGVSNLPRCLELLFAAGARTVYARAVPAGTGDFSEAFAELFKEDINIIVAPELETSTAVTLLAGLAEAHESTGKEVIAVVGSDGDSVSAIEGHVAANKRLILAAPGIRAQETILGADGHATSSEVTLAGRYTAAVVAGKLSTLTPQTSPTNKTIASVGKLARRFSYSDTKDLITGGVLVLEERLGVRVVRGITTEMASNGPFQQITTRRIVDFAKAGIRKASDPFIGRLNNQRVRKALHGAIDGFLTTMVQDEALTTYQLEVTASRADEIAGRAMVSAMLQPTFSIDFIAVTLMLE